MNLRNRYANRRRIPPEHVPDARVLVRRHSDTRNTNSFLKSPIIAGAVFISLIVLYRLETRVELLSMPAANRLGLVLGLANLLWATFRILREFNNPEMLNTNWALLGLALVGPLVMTLMPAKLARREQHAGDYWWLHGLALATASLAGAMADDFLTFILISLYSICAIWSLNLFYLRRAAGSVLPVPGQPTAPARRGHCADNDVGECARSLGVTALAVAVTAPVYLLTPRSTFQKLDFGKSRVEIGYAADQMIDLTKTGDLKANQQIAFEFTAVNEDGSPKTDLSHSISGGGVVPLRAVQQRCVATPVISDCRQSSPSPSDASESGRLRSGRGRSVHADVRTSSRCSRAVSCRSRHVGGSANRRLSRL